MPFFLSIFITNYTMIFKCKFWHALLWNILLHTILWLIIQNFYHIYFDCFYDFFDILYYDISYKIFTMYYTITIYVTFLWHTLPWLSFNETFWTYYTMTFHIKFLPHKNLLILKLMLTGAKFYSLRNTVLKVDTLLRCRIWKG